MLFFDFESVCKKFDLLAQLFKKYSFEIETVYITNLLQSYVILLDNLLHPSVYFYFLIYLRINFHFIRTHLILSELFLFTLVCLQSNEESYLLTNGTLPFLIPQHAGQIYVDGHKLALFQSTSSDWLAALYTTLQFQPTRNFCTSLLRVKIYSLQLLFFNFFVY